MILIPNRGSLIILADTSCYERGIAKYSRIRTASRPYLDVSKVRDLFAIKHYGQNACMNLMPRYALEMAARYIRGLRCFVERQTAQLGGYPAKGHE
jgi:hypothetical protein